MTRLEGRLRDSRPAPVTAPEHRRELKEAIRRHVLAEARVEPWSLSRYAAALAASLALMVCVCGGTLLWRVPESRFDPALQALMAELQSAPAPGMPASRLPALEEEIRTDERLAHQVASYVEQRRLLEELLAAGI